MLPDRVGRLLTAYVDGELGTQQRKVVVRWLRRSPEARALLRGLQKDAAQLSSLPRQTLGQDFAQQVLQAIAHRQAKSAGPSVLTLSSYLPRWTGVATAAAALLVLGLGAYFYFSGDRSRQAEPLAVRMPESGHSLPAEEPAEARVPNRSLAKPNFRERLGFPVPEKHGSPASTVAIQPTENSQLQDGTRQMPLGSRPIEKRLPPFHADDPNPPLLEIRELVFDFRELIQEKLRQQLQRVLQKSDSHRIDLGCKDSLAGIERLRSTFRTQGVHFIIDQDAQAALKLGMGSGTPFAIYCEDLTAHEIVMVLEQLSRENRKGFDRLAITTMPWENGKKLSYNLGIDADQWSALKTLRPEPGKPDRATADRRALVVAYTPGRPRPTSEALKRFFDNRKERHGDTIRVFLVLSPSSG